MIPDYDGFTLLLNRVEHYFRSNRPCVYCSTKIDELTTMVVVKHVGQWRLCITINDETKPLVEAPLSVRVAACKHFEDLEKSRAQAVANLVPEVESAKVLIEQFLENVNADSK